jgi:hypothetical protein
VLRGGRVEIGGMGSRVARKEQDVSEMAAASMHEYRCGVSDTSGTGNSKWADSNKQGGQREYGGKRRVRQTATSRAGN